MGFWDKVRVNMQESKKKSSIRRMIDSQIYNSVGRIDKKFIQEIATKVKGENIDYKLPRGLVQYMDIKYPDHKLEDSLRIFISHEKSRIKDSAELEKAKRLNITKVKIRTSRDSRVCHDCKKHANKSYSIDQVPRLPLCWECRCYYEPQV